MGQSGKIPQIECQPLQWSRLVKERDFHRCVVCGRQDELVACRANHDVGLTLENGVTLCAECMTNGGEVRYSSQSTRLNLEVDRSLYLLFREKCRSRKASISAVVRSLMVEFLERREK